jgi:hypothetical protein
LSIKTSKNPRRYLTKLRLKPMKIERHIFHRKVAKSAEMIDLFSLPLRRRQRKMLMPFGQYLLAIESLREACGLSLFCPPCPVECEANSTGISRKGKKLPPRRSPCPVKYWKIRPHDVFSAFILEYLYYSKQNPLFNRVNLESPQVSVGTSGEI